MTQAGIAGQCLARQCLAGQRRSASVADGFANEGNVAPTRSADGKVAFDKGIAADAARGVKRAQGCL